MFELSKWYGDCISESGDLRIAYSARVRYGRLKIGYSGLLDGQTAAHALHRAAIFWASVVIPQRSSNIGRLRASGWKLIRRGVKPSNRINRMEAFPFIAE